MRTLVDVYATQGGGYAFYDKDTKTYRFVQVPPGIGHGFRVMDSVPDDWSVTGPVAKGKLRVHTHAKVTYSVERIDFFDVCPCCLNPLNDCDCFDLDIWQGMGCQRITEIPRKKT